MMKRGGGLESLLTRTLPCKTSNLAKPQTSNLNYHLPAVLHREGSVEGGQSYLPPNPNDTPCPKCPLLLLPPFFQRTIMGKEDGGGASTRLTPGIAPHSRPKLPDQAAPWPRGPARLLAPPPRTWPDACWGGKHPPDPWKNSHGRPKRPHQAAPRPHGPTRQLPLPPLTRPDAWMPGSAPLTTNASAAQARILRRRLPPPPDTACIAC